MANSNFIVHNGLTVGALTIDAATGNISTSGVLSSTNSTYPANFSGDMTVAGNISMTGTGYLDIPAGTTAQRPSSPNSGMIRYNSDLTSFEGYGGVAWASLGGVKSVDGKAYIQAETAPNAGDDVIRVYAGDSGSSTQVMWASTSNVKILPTTTATSTTTGALQVAGGASIAGNLYVGSNAVITGNLNVLGTQTIIASQDLTVNDSVINLHTAANLAPLTSDDGRDIGFKFHYYKTSAGGDNLAFLGWANDSSSLEYYATGTEGAGNVFTGSNYGTIKGGELVSANSTSSTSTTTGALRVAGGAGIAGAVYNGGVHVSNGNIVAASGTASTNTTTGALVVTGGAGISGALNVGSSITAAGMTTSSAILPNANNTLNIGASGTVFATVYATTFSGVSTTAKYADLAENYQADSNYTYGTVVMFGGTEEVTVATADTKAVAGVVSQNPAHLMNGGLSGANVVPLALQGRVPCNVIGPIKKGDLLVSAGFGYAKSNNNAQAGQIIGKALADFTGAKGQIEVVVGRF
jgi:cytoskeletal protein CcmA (bactofilin family)